MDTGTDPPRRRRLRKASDLRTAAAAYPPPKRMKEHNSCHEDKMSSLPDDMLILIIDKLDARTATITTILSKRWRDLYTHSHTCYDLMVDDVLPPRYHRLKQIVVGDKAGYEAEKNALKSGDNYASRDQLYSFKDWKWKVRLLTPILLLKCICGLPSPFHHIYTSTPPLTCDGESQHVDRLRGELPPLEYLVLQLRGRQMWIELTTIPDQLNHLKKLFIANVPMNWDTLWILHLLAAAPALESLHVHFDDNSEKAGATGSPDVQAEHHQHHHHLKELVVIGFDGAAWQTGFVKRIMQASPILERVHLLDGHVVEDKDHELVGPKRITSARDRRCSTD